MAEKVTLESLDARLDKADASPDPIETDPVTLLDVEAQHSEFSAATRRLATNLAAFRQEMIDALDAIKLQQKTMTAAVMEALNQLNLSRTYEQRIVRLEEAVFGKAD